MFTYYLSRGFRQDWSVLCGAALEVSTGLAHAIIEMDLGIALGDVAHLERSLDEFRSLGNTGGVATCLTNLSEVLEKTGDVDVAIATGEKCLALARELGHDCVEAEVLEHLGSAYGRTGDERELDCYRASLRLHEKEGNDRGGAGVLRRIGALHRRFGRLDDAIAVLSESLASFRAEGDPAGETACLEELGRTHLLRGDHAAAQDVLRRGLAVAEAYGDLGRQASLRQHLAKCAG